MSLVRISFIVTSSFSMAATLRYTASGSMNQQPYIQYHSQRQLVLVCNLASKFIIVMNRIL